MSGLIISSPLSRLAISSLRLMNTNHIQCMARRPGNSRWLARLLFVVTSVSAFGTFACASAAQPLFDAPPPSVAADDVWLVSTRAMGTICASRAMDRGLYCQRLIRTPQGDAAWKAADWRSLMSSAVDLPTVVYVHGNRVEPGEDRTQGMQVYQSLKANQLQIRPIRFVIWSWPSDKIPGPIKDYLVKAQRTNPAAWQLAWVLDKLPVDDQISLVGYSYGTRVVSGAAQLLAGGRLGTLALSERTHPHRPPVQAALIAAAFDADWVQPGQFYGQSLTQFRRLILGTNQHDPAMRFYHLSNGRGRMHALGKAGIHQPATLGSATRRIRQVDFSSEVGRSHALVDYLRANEKMRVVWQQLMTVAESPTRLVQSTQAAVRRGRW